MEPFKNNRNLVQVVKFLGSNKILVIASTAGTVSAFVVYRSEVSWNELIESIKKEVNQGVSEGSLPKKLGDATINNVCMGRWEASRNLDQIKQQTSSINPYPAINLHSYHNPNKAAIKSGVTVFAVVLGFLLTLKYINTYRVNCFKWLVNKLSK